MLERFNSSKHCSTASILWCNCRHVPSKSVSRLVNGVGVLSLNLANKRFCMDLNWAALCPSCSYKNNKKYVWNNNNRKLESVHYNLVWKMICHIGVQVLHPANLRTSSERVTHNNWFHKILLYKSHVLHDPLRGFSQMCRMQNLTSNIWLFFSN